MHEFKLDGDASIRVDQGEFAVVIKSYADVNISRLTNLDYLGSSVRPTTPGMMGGTNDVVLKFRAKHKGEGNIGLAESGTSYETSLPVEERQIDIRVEAA